MLVLTHEHMMLFTHSRPHTVLESCPLRSANKGGWVEPLTSAMRLQRSPPQPGQAAFSIQNTTRVTYSTTGEQEKLLRKVLPLILEE